MAQLTHPVLVFFAFTFAISGILAGPLIASLHGLLPVRLPPVLALLASIGPGLAAVATVALEEGHSGLRGLLNAALHWRVRLVWYLVALLFAPLALTVTFAVNTWLGAPFPSLVERWLHLPLLFLMVTVQTGFGEELGWRGFAQQRLQKDRGPLQAALVVGLAWSAWHLALFVIPGSMQWQLSRAAGALPAVAGYSAHLLLTAVLYAIVMNASGSVLMPILLHGSTNATAWLFSLNDIATQGVRPMVLLTLLEGTVVVAWLLAQRMPRGRRRRPTRG